VATALGSEVAIVAEFQEGVEVLGTFQINAAAVAPIATAGAATRDELLPPESHTAVSACARRHVDLGLVNEHVEQPAFGIREKSDPAKPGIRMLKHFGQKQ
jgi:hypothetical protein